MPRKPDFGLSRTSTETLSLCPLCSQLRSFGVPILVPKEAQNT